MVFSCAILVHCVCNLCRDFILNLNDYYFFRKFDVRHFNKLLKYAMNRILQDANVSDFKISKTIQTECLMSIFRFSFFQLQQFQFPVNKSQYPDYNDIIIYPINLSKIEDNIENLRYTNSEAFMSDIKWILHNCSIYFAGKSIEL